jgi:hypothetical protein
MFSARYRPYLQPMPGLGQPSRTTGAVILGGPRAGAGSAGRIYNFYNALPARYQQKFLQNLRTNSALLYTNIPNETFKQNNFYKI